MATNLDKTILRHRERLAAAEAKAAHLEKMKRDALYRRLNRAKTGLEAVIENYEDSGESPLIAAIAHLDMLMLELREEVM
jgi:hypothetical protein